MTASPPRDAIVVLGHSAGRDDPFMRERVEHGVNLFRAGVAPWIVMSGKCSFQLATPPETEAAIMRERAVDLGVPAGQVVLEEESTDTLSNAYFTKVRVLRPRSWRRVGLVTSDSHMRRALWLFRKVLGPEYDIEASEALSAIPPEDLHARVQRNDDLLRRMQVFLAAVPDGDDEAIGRLLFSSHPGYVSDPQLTAEFRRVLL